MKRKKERVLPLERKSSFIVIVVVVVVVMVVVTVALWFRTTKNPNVSTRSLDRSLARSLAPLTHSFPRSRVSE